MLLSVVFALTLFENHGLDPEAAHLFMVALFSGMGMVCAASSAYILYNAMADWQTDFLYKPSLPFMLNIVLMLSRLVYIMVVAVITNRDTDGGRCLFTGFMAQFFDTYFAFVLLAMLWSTTQDAITVMVEYPSNVVSKDHLDQLLRLSMGGALGVVLDKKKLMEGEIAPKVPCVSINMFCRARLLLWPTAAHCGNRSRVTQIRRADDITSEEENADEKKEGDKASQSGNGATD
jgi:hypothetical protein